jgi:hypothetical protein
LTRLDFATADAAGAGRSQRRLPKKWANPSEVDRRPRNIPRMPRGGFDRRQRDMLAPRAGDDWTPTGSPALLVVDSVGGSPHQVERPLAAHLLLASTRSASRAPCLRHLASIDGDVTAASGETESTLNSRREDSGRHIAFRRRKARRSNVIYFTRSIPRMDYTLAHLPSFWLKSS